MSRKKYSAHIWKPRSYSFRAGTGATPGAAMLLAYPYHWLDLFDQFKNLECPPLCHASSTVLWVFLGRWGDEGCLEQREQSVTSLRLRGQGRATLGPSFLEPQVQRHHFYARTEERRQSFPKRRQWRLRKHLGYTRVRTGGSSEP